MIKQKKQLFFLISGIAIVVLSSFVYYVYAATATVSLEITGIGLRHGTPDNANLGVLATSTGDQEISGQFNDYFRVEDMEGHITGHYTTIQCDGVYGPSGYTLTGVYLKAEDIDPIRIFGLTGNVHINPIFSGYYSILSPATYIYKPTDPANKGIINRYGDKPRLKIVIPAYAPPGSYSGTIVFSFYMY